MTRAKFRVDSIERTRGNVQNFETKQWEPKEMWTLKASPVYQGSDPEAENTKFWQATPSGSLVLSTVNATALAGFDLGTEFYVDLTPVS